MNSNNREPGKIRDVQGSYLLRNEHNGLTVYDRKEHLFYFYEGIFIGDLPERAGQVEINGVHKLMAEKKELLTTNIRSDDPFSICWLISGNCNLNCIYCFAGNKMVTRQSASPAETATAQHILGLNPLSVTLSGGEPTLNPKIRDVLQLFKGKAGTVLDTNGTTPQLMKLIPVLKDTNTTVRLTVDILDDEILSKLRPWNTSSEHGAEESACSQSEILRQSIRALTEAGVPLVIHTVLTRYNIGKLETTAEELVHFGVRRWHFYPVNYSKKCSSFYDRIKVSRQEACDYTDALAERFGNSLQITCPRNDIGDRERAVLLIDSSGRFCVDTIQNGCLFPGKDPFFPTKEEIMAGLDYELHKQAYLCNFWK